MKQYLLAIARSFYSPVLYRDVVYRWQGIGALYLLLVGALIAVFIVAATAGALKQFGRDHLPDILRQMPNMVMDYGVLTAEGEQPIAISLPNGMTMVIDTVAEPKDLLETKGDIIIGRTNAVFKNPNRDVDVRTYKDFKGRWQITAENVQAFWPKVVWGALLMWPFVAIGDFIRLMVVAVLVAVLSYVITAYMKEEYPFETRLRFAAVALTPAVFISRIALVFKHETQFWFMPLVACLYIYVMIRAIRQMPPETSLDV